MGMETTWDELRVAVLQKMHLIEGDKVVEDDSTREHIAAMPAAYNEAVRLLSTTNRYITKYFEVSSSGLENSLVVDLSSVVDDLFMIKPGGIYLTDKGGRTGAYYNGTVIGDKDLILDGSTAGIYRIYYYAYPVKATSETSGDEDMQIDPDVASLVPLYMASQLWKEEEPGLATAYRNEFEIGRELLVRERNDGFSAQFRNTTGWW
mgnify:FL=1|jgi:hypothetical protein